MKKFLIFQLGILFAFTALANNKMPQVGLASYYGASVNHHRVACGERYCKDSFTAAHRSLPFGTFLKVTNLKNHKTVIVRVNDRGPHRRHRIIDLSYAAASELDFVKSGLTKVKVELASLDEIAASHSKCFDSIPNDTLVRNSAIKALADTIYTDKYMIQGGAYGALKYAVFIKKMLVDSGIGTVSIFTKKTGRRHHRSHIIYKVVIGPLNRPQKDKALGILRKKNINGWVRAI